MKTQLFKLTAIIMLFISYGLSAQNFETLGGENPYFSFFYGEETDVTSGVWDQNMECPDNSLHGQTSDDLLQGCGGVLSDEASDIIVGQQFIDIYGLIGGVKVFAIETTPGNYTCSVDEMNVTVKLYTDDNGLPGEVVYETTQSVHGILTGDLHPACGNDPIKEYTVLFDEGIELNNGYFSFCSSGDNGDCCIRILTIVEGVGTAVTSASGVWEPIMADQHVSYCLLPLEVAAEAPGEPSSLVVVPDASGAPEALVTWTNPVVTATGTALTELTEVYLYVNGELETTLSNPTIGGNESYTYNAPLPDNYHFEVYGANSQGDGLTQNVDIYVGMDVPEAPINPTVVSADLNGQLSWEVPIVGLNGGYYDGSVSEYQIVRHPDEAIFTVAGNLTTMTDETIPGVAPYTYSVTAYNAIGEGGTSETAVSYLGGGVSPTLVIGEKATGTWCMYCPGAALGFEDLTAAGFPMGLISYHAEDSYTIDAGIGRINYYDVEGFPTAIFDGVSSFSGGDPIMSLIAEYTPMVEARLEAKTAVTIEISDALVIDNALTAQLVVEKVGNFINENTTVHAVLTESHIPEQWITQSELNHVSRALFNGAAGTAVDLMNNTTVTVPISIPLEEAWVDANCELVVFIQDDNSKEILNGNKVAVSAVGVNEIVDNAFSMYPNPASGMVTVKNGSAIDQLQVYNQVGQLVSSLSPNRIVVNLDLSDLETGVYFVKVVSQNQSVTRKLVVE